MKLALYTFGQFLRPSKHPANDGFHAVNDAILEVIEAAPGFIARSGYLSDHTGGYGPPSWGEETYPRFYRDNGDGWAPATLSLWTDIESAMAATYYGAHGQVMKEGRGWFQKPQWPPLVLWWVKDHRRPCWQDGARRLEHLQDHGPTARGFAFTAPFDAAGQRCAIDRTALATRRAKEGGDD